MYNTNLSQNRVRVCDILFGQNVGIKLRSLVSRGLPTHTF